jgi:predicted RNA-binding Zn-ribbon protein involved in translation (DUF1610 family)
MFNRLRRWLNRFFNRTRTINNEPLNKVSLIVIILIDIFILINVFTGLDDISKWYLSPSQVYPCYAEWNAYQEQTSQTKDYDAIRLALPDNTITPFSVRETYQQVEPDHLGTVSEICVQYADLKDKINNPENQNIIKTIDQKQTEIGTLDQENRNIRAQYDSTLLEQIAGQPRNQSINAVEAARAKQQLDQNNATIASLKTDISNLKDELVSKPESVSFLSFLKNSGSFSAVEQGYERASFWYPSIQLVFQAFFLLPLIFIAASVHSFAQRRRYGLVTLISWHLLVIFCIPLIIKVFEFLQVGVIFQFLFDLIQALFGGLLFLLSYVYILLIPLIGFGIIKFFQTVVFNAKLQAAGRFQKTRCIKCAKKIRSQDAYCPHCGYGQFTECHTCHELTYSYLPHCRNCGATQEPHR